MKKRISSRSSKKTKKRRKRWNTATVLKELNRLRVDLANLRAELADLLRSLPKSKRRSAR